MRYLPIHVDLKEAKVVVIGGGVAAEAKLRTVIKTDAHIILFADQIRPEIKKWVDSGSISWLKREFTNSDFDDARLAYVATDDATTNTKIAKIARQKNIPVNVADQKSDCTFITPALVDRSPVTISIGTEGTSPGLARAIKSDLESRLPSTLGSLARFVKGARKRVAKRIPDLAGRQRFWAEIFGTKDLTAQLRLSEEALGQKIAALLGGENESGGGPIERSASSIGMVSLVGAGPGNPDYLTHQARQKLHSADVIVYDRLVSQGVLDFGRREAEYIYVGKVPNGKSTPQGEINGILVAKAKLGLSVVRLKSGDPLIFGRADEEIEALEAHDLAFEIVPGITSAAAAAASIGSSLTSRGHNKSISFLTGHDAKGFAEHDWSALSQPGARAAVYMGVGAARFIQGRLLLHGAARDLPISVVENASRPNEIIVSATLDNLPEKLARANIKGPAILLVGYMAKKSIALQTYHVGEAS